jgi:hypothetical protein
MFVTYAVGLDGCPEPTLKVNESANDAETIIPVANTLNGKAFLKYLIINSSLGSI